MSLDKRTAGNQTPAMSDDSKPDQEPIPNPRPKRQPPVIDAEAKEIPPPGAASASKGGSNYGFAGMRDRLPKLAWSGAFSAVIVALLSGAAAGLVGAWLFASPANAPGDVSAIRTEISQLASRIAQQEAKPTPLLPDLAPLSERTNKLETSLGELRGELAELKKISEALANAPTAAEVASLNRRLATIEEKLGTLAATPKPEVPRETPQPAEIVTLGSLRDAIAAGAPFARELAAVRAILKERAAELAPLEKFAADGLPAVALLAKRFEPFAAKIANPPAPDGGVVTRLWNNATRMIEVRPVGEPQGNEPGSIVARMETKLGRGDLAGALDEAKALSPQSRELAKDWFDAAERRRDAEALIKNLINAALASIAAERKAQ